MAKLPKHIALSITHNDFAVYYQTAAEYLDDRTDDEFASPGDRARCIATGEVWEAHWYPETPVSFSVLIAPTSLELMVALAREGEADGV